MVENYILAKQTISKKLDSNHPMYPFMVSALYGLLCKYHTHKDVILSLYQKTDIIFESGKVEDILRKHGIQPDDMDPIHDDENEEITTFGVSNSGHTFVEDQDGNLLYKRDKPFIVCSTSINSFTRLLNTFCHEMGHLIKGEVNGTSSRQEKDSYIFIIRTGLAHYVYCYMNNFQELKFISSYAVLDEAINCIQTTDVMKEILALGEFVDDSNIQSFIDSLDRDDMLQDHGYETIVKLVHSYWDQDEFKNLIESHIIDGNIDTILEKFDGVLGENTFDTMSYILDQIYELEGIDPDDPKIDDWITAFKASADAYKKHVKINQKVK